MKWVLLFVMILPNDQISLQRMEFQSASLCEQAKSQMLNYNKEQVLEERKLKEEAGKILKVTAFSPLLCIQVAE